MQPKRKSAKLSAKAFLSTLSTRSSALVPWLRTAKPKAGALTPWVPPHVGDRTEGELIKAFAERVGRLRPQLITWNGHSFDLPVLRYRVMVNRVAAEGLQVRQYFHRYTEDALDLCDYCRFQGTLRAHNRRSLWGLIVVAEGWLQSARVRN